MDLKEKINQDLKDAMKSKDGLRLGTLRMVSAAIHNREIEKKGKREDSLSEEELLEVLGKEAKKRKESAEAYEKGGRNDLAEKERSELNIIKYYLPPELDDNEIRLIIEETIKDLGEGLTEKDFGKVMGKAMPKLKGRADSSKVSMIVKEALGR